MTPKERVQAALNHKKTDRMPQYEFFFPEFIRNWKRENNLKEEDDIYENYSNIDIGRILATQTGPFSKQAESRNVGDDTIIRDSWGRILRTSKNGKLFEVIETVIKEKSDLDKLVFEAPSSSRDDIKRIANANDVSERFAPVSGVMGLFMPCYYLRGEMNFLIDLIEDEVFCHNLIRKVANFIKTQGENVLEASGTYDTAMWVYDDFGTNKGSLISPAFFEKFFVPIYKEIISYWKSLGLKNIILHHDGNSWEILDLLIEAGFTGIQGIYPSANMSIPSVKAKYGNKLNLIGGICNISVLAGSSKKAIENNVASIFEVAKDGGVIMGSHSIEEDIPIENYDYYYKTVMKYNEKW